MTRNRGAIDPAKGYGAIAMDLLMAAAAMNSTGFDLVVRDHDSLLRSKEEGEFPLPGPLSGRHLLQAFHAHCEFAPAAFRAMDAFRSEIRALLDPYGKTATLFFGGERDGHRILSVILTRRGEEPRRGLDAIAEAGARRITDAEVHWLCREVRQRGERARESLDFLDQARAAFLAGEVEAGLMQLDLGIKRVGEIDEDTSDIQ